MSKQISDYTNLITSEHITKPNFVATVSFSVAPYVQGQALNESLSTIFDIDQNPVGDQLDKIGERVGISRIIENPFSNIFFTWDGVASNGWDFGIWQSPDNPSAIVSLPDDIYLTLIKAKIAANSWDGTTEGAYAIFRLLFPDFTLIYNDYENMSYAVAIQGMVPDSLTLALIVGGYLNLRPEGVLVTEYFIPVNTGPLFAWDSDSSSLQGWDSGSWAQEYYP